jgi:hypothetical protein
MKTKKGFAILNLMPLAFVALLISSVVFMIALMVNSDVGAVIKNSDSATEDINGSVDDVLTVFTNSSGLLAVVGIVVVAVIIIGVVGLFNAMQGRQGGM